MSSQTPAEGYKEKKEVAKEAPAAAAKEAPKAQKRKRREALTGVAYIQSSFNNTIITITDPIGNVCFAGPLQVEKVSKALVRARLLLPK